MKEIEIIIDTDGQIGIDAIGFKGKGCEELTKQIAKALGQIVESKKKQEYWEQTVVTKQKVRY